MRECHISGEFLALQDPQREHPRQGVDKSCKEVRWIIAHLSAYVSWVQASSSLPASELAGMIEGGSRYEIEKLGYRLGSRRARVMGRPASWCVDE